MRLLQEHLLAIDNVDVALDRNANTLAVEVVDDCVLEVGIDAVDAYRKHVRENNLDENSLGLVGDSPVAVDGLLFASIDVPATVVLTIGVLHTSRNCSVASVICEVAINIAPSVECNKVGDEFLSGWVVSINGCIAERSY